MNSRRLIIAALCLIVVVRLGGFTSPTYDPLPMEPVDLPDPWDDPVLDLPPMLPDPFDDPFDPINDLPLPAPFDDFPFDDPFNPPIPLPDPWDIDDPFDLDEPSIFDPSPAELLTDFAASFPPGNSPAAARPFSNRLLGHPNAAAAQPVTNAFTFRMPYPMQILFPPAPPQNAAYRQPATRTCSPTTSTTLLIPEFGHGKIAFANTCPPYAIKHVLVNGTMPGGVAVTPDGKTALVTVLDTAQVLIVDVASQTVTGSIAIPPLNGVTAQPNSIAILPDGSKAYVGDHVSIPESAVYVINLATNTVTGTIPVGAFPARIRATPDGSQVWVSCRGDGDVFVIDTLTDTTVITIANIPETTGIAFNPTGTRAYVAAGIEAGGYVQVINTANYSTIAQIPVGNLPNELVMSSAGKYLWVTNPLSNFISLIDMGQNAVIHNIKAPMHALGLSLVHRQ